MGMFSSFSLQDVTKIEASEHAQLESAPLIIRFECDDYFHGTSEIVIHTRNAELTLALAAAINGAVAAVKEKQTAAIAA
jgi:hypothetical protein